MKLPPVRPLPDSLVFAAFPTAAKPRRPVTLYIHADKRGIVLPADCPAWLQFKDLEQVEPRLSRVHCFATDNPAFNGRYLQAEYELALNHDVIDFRTFVRCRRNAFAGRAGRAGPRSPAGRVSGTGVDRPVTTIARHVRHLNA